MDRHIDIRVMPDPEFSTPVLMNALISKLHRALASLGSEHIGISLPEHRNKSPRGLGGLLRLHSNAVELDQLLATDWLQGMRDHVTTSNILAVPESPRHRTVRRRQFKTNAERLRRRRAQRHGETMEQARELIPVSVERRVSLPYAILRSQSTQQSFCLFIEHGPLTDTPVSGTFNSYGLSDTATVPWF